MDIVCVISGFLHDNFADVESWIERAAAAGALRSSAVAAHTVVQEEQPLGHTWKQCRRSEWERALNSRNLLHHWRWIAELWLV